MVERKTEVWKDVEPRCLQREVGIWVWMGQQVVFTSSPLILHDLVFERIGFKAW